MASFSGVLGTSLVLFGGKDDSTYYNDFYILDLSKLIYLYSNLQESLKWIKARTSGGKKNIIDIKELKFVRWS